MKKIILVLFFILSFSPHFNLRASEENPSTFCDQNTQCTDKMRKIVLEYKSGNKQFSQLINDTPMGFSGSCYHISYLYDSNHEHHGAFIFERSGNDLMTDGVFNFFFNEDPYQQMTSFELKTWFLQSNSQMSLALEKTNQIELQFLGNGSDYHYWFRNNKKNNKLMLIGKQMDTSTSALIFCEMTRRP